MKKLIFVALAAIALVACDPKVEGKCTDITELQEAVLNNSTDTARYDLNGDGEVNIADVNFLLANSKDAKCDSIATDSI